MAISIIDSTINTIMSSPFVVRVVLNLVQKVTIFYRVWGPLAGMRRMRRLRKMRKIRRMWRLPLKDLILKQSKHPERSAHFAHFAHSAHSCAEIRITTKNRE